MPLNKHELNREVPIPLYYQLKSFLLEEIKNGNYKIGASIPTEYEIQQMFKISRFTVRQAISELVQEGWLSRQTSKGTFVTHPKEDVSHIRSFEPFYQQVARSGMEARTELVDLKVIEAGEVISSYLNIDPKSKVISMFRRRYSNNMPMVTMQNFLPYSLCSFILSHDFEKESLYEVLSQHIESRTSVTKTIVSATKSTAEDVTLLGIKPGVPILSFNTITRTESGNIIDYAFSRYRGDMNKFEIDVYPEKDKLQSDAEMFEYASMEAGSQSSHKKRGSGTLT
ncbi:GntR family transcriptional regulator [Ruminiclostridium sufflavum DSM 19573]|uniref:GntR family transcriptional regulator n=1 Tax=Ruminiclostridium sufflavum DSM 19573 TaxID=1121337 RepID=A0A318XYR8_9FIRM|nr:GntR family transcriptional regulator [Ruminiclostridium sufflavum]PYG88007.1 GntR family transcriptional regulator [Ruminiclostridium sufflavum DSM 19573]